MVSEVGWVCVVEGEWASEVGWVCVVEGEWVLGFFYVPAFLT